MNSLDMNMAPPKTTNSSISSLIKMSLRKSSEAWWPLIKQYWVHLTLILIFVHTHTLIFQFLSKSAPMSDTVRLLAQAGSTLVGSLKTFFLLILIPFGIQAIEKQKPLPYMALIKKYAMDLTLESLRMFAFLILWFFALILPSLYKQTQWYFMPFLVMLSRSYEENGADPLKLSASLVTGMTLPLFLLIVVDGTLQFFIDRYSLMPYTTPHFDWLQAILMILGPVTSMGYSVFSMMFFYYLFIYRCQSLEKINDLKL